MSLDLTPPEVVRLVQIIRSIPEGTMVMNEQDQLTLLEDDEHAISLAEKINALGERKDVQEYIEEHYGGKDA